MSAVAGRPWAATADGVSLVVRLTPKGGRDAIDGVAPLADGRAALKARVRAVPENGKANAALVKLIAKVLGLPARDVTLVAGATARTKQLAISGDGPMLIAALEKMAGWTE